MIGTAALVDVAELQLFDRVGHLVQVMRGQMQIPGRYFQIFMPDVDEIRHNRTNQNISMEWLKNRNAPPPPDVTSK